MPVIYLGKEWDRRQKSNEELQQEMRDWSSRTVKENVILGHEKDMQSHWIKYKGSDCLAGKVEGLL